MPERRPWHPGQQLAARPWIAGSSKATTLIGGTVSEREVIYRHSGTVRITHWVNALVLLVLLMSGLQIFNAHPALYLGAKSNFSDPIMAMGLVQDGNSVKGVTTLFGWEFNTTGVFGLGGNAESGYQERGFPWWATLPGYRNLAMGRRWHFFFAWLFLFNGLAYLLWSLGSGHLRRDLAPTGSELKHIGASIAEHARLKFPRGEEAKRYNVLQKLTYLFVALILLPLMLLTGLTMSPGMDAAFPILLDVLGGRQTARTIHFISASFIVIFVVVHVVMVLISGVWNNLRSMITGRYVIEPTGEKP
jgi:thiosulfate reductase cytochrome b subunit